MILKLTLLQCVLVAPTIVNAIEGGVDPEAACTVLTLCDASGITDESIFIINSILNKKALIKL